MPDGCVRGQWAGVWRGIWIGHGSRESGAFKGPGGIIRGAGKMFDIQSSLEILGDFHADEADIVGKLAGGGEILDFLEQFGDQLVTVRASVAADSGRQ